MRKKIRTILTKRAFKGGPTPGTKAHARARRALGLSQEPRWNTDGIFMSEVRNKMPRPRTLPPLAPEGGIPGTRQGSFREVRFHVLNGGIAYDDLIDTSVELSYSQTQEVLRYASERHVFEDRQVQQPGYSTRNRQQQERTTHSARAGHS